MAEPFIEMPDLINKVIHGDCLGVMKQIPDKSIDLILTDPPYGIGESLGKNQSRSNRGIPAKDYGYLDWDKEIPSKEVFQEMFRISKKQIIFGGNYFVEFLHNSPCWIVWDKDNGINDFADCELIWTSYNSAVRKITYRWNGMLQENMKEKEKRYHPTQKPVGLIKRILTMYAKKGWIVADFFAGSGSILVAAEELGYQWIGVEKEKDYCAIAEKRIKEAQSQGMLL